MKTRLTLASFILVLSSLGVVHAAEQEQARKECEDVMRLYYAKEQEAQKEQKQQIARGKVPDIASACTENGQTVEYWQCIRKKIYEGNQFSDAASQCKDLNNGG
ncbi:hypothetical protein O5O45_25905 [Hahella aquimaris]|uniref:hypothetical protein n=1 Tax=Hahella sp. HNIBRBA332 TaxID=3015983 RepID=UPI00273A89AF|nr:hypothetical protein [Hahella sp. HNIBRBA332]WLQ13168.1 hypothetical protein O5O45_25905 [Hahella sp. HNIBRBA332]